jgi:hypothetical protein
MGPKVPLRFDRRLPRIPRIVRLCAAPSLGSPRDEGNRNRQYRVRRRLGSARRLRQLHSRALPKFSPAQEFAQSKSRKGTPDFLRSQALASVLSLRVILSKAKNLESFSTPAITTLCRYPAPRRKQDLFLPPKPHPDTSSTPPHAAAQYPSATPTASSPRSTAPCSLSSSPARSSLEYPSS